MFKLQFKDNPNRSIWLVGEKITIGSHGDNTVVLDGLGIDEFHAEILISPERLVLRSTPGSCIVNDLPVDDHFEMGANDELRIGKERFLIIDPQHLSSKTASGKDKPAKKRADWYLVPDHAKLKALDFSITDKAILGRSTGCKLSVPYKLLSREHAEFWLEDGVLHLKDLGSSNGSFVNGERVEQASLKNGDKVAFAKLVFEVKGPETSKPVAKQKQVDNNLTMDRTIIRPAVNLDLELSEIEASRVSRSIELDAVDPVVEPVALESPGDATGGENKDKRRAPVLAAFSLLALAAVAAAWFIAQN